MANRVSHFEVIGHDMSALCKFYKEAFDWTTKPAGPSYAMVHPGDGGINGGIGVPMDGVSSYVTFYVEVADLQQALQKIQGLGGKISMQPVQVPNGPEIAMFRDPEGHLVGLVKSR